MTYTCRAYWHTRGVIISPAENQRRREKKNRMAEKCNNNAGEKGMKRDTRGVPDARLPLWRLAEESSFPNQTPNLYFSFYKWELNTRLHGKFSHAELCDA